MNINKSAWDEKQYYPNDLYAPLCYKHLRQWNKYCLYLHCLQA
jgi:hypothetical protein